VQFSFPEITRLLTQPNGIGALRMENGVGETPVEIAIQHDLLLRTRTKLNIPSTPKTLELRSEPVKPARFDARRKAEVAKLKNTLDMLVEEGNLRVGSELFNRLLAFIEKMETMPLSAEVVQEDTQPQRGRRIHPSAHFGRSEVSPNVVVTEDTKAPKDDVNASLTLQLIQEAASANPGPRSLLHLLDVQKSVQDDLRKSADWRGRSQWEGFAKKSLLHHSGFLNMVESWPSFASRKDLVI
jgi:hypothetical protein